MASFLSFYVSFFFWWGKKFIFLIFQHLNDFFYFDNYTLNFQSNFFLVFWLSLYPRLSISFCFSGAMHFLIFLRILIRDICKFFSVPHIFFLPGIKLSVYLSSSYSSEFLLISLLLYNKQHQNLMAWTYNLLFLMVL